MNDDHGPSPAELTDAELRFEKDPDPLLALIDAMPPEQHNKANAAMLSGGSQWVAFNQREAALYVAMTDAEKAEQLCTTVEGINTRGYNRPDWADTLLDAVSGLDVDMVRELLNAGVKADQTYVCEQGNLWDIGSYALFTFGIRAHVFPRATELWAERCAQIVAMSVNAGGPRWLSVWLGPEVAPVLACDCLRGLGLRGDESFEELRAELGRAMGLEPGDDPDITDAVAVLLEEAGAFDRAGGPHDPATQRLNARMGEWLASVEGCDCPTESLRVAAH